MVHDREKISFYSCLCLNYQIDLFNFASGLCWDIVILSLTVIILTVLWIHSAAARFLLVVAERWGLCQRTIATALIYVCVCMLARAGCGCVRVRAIAHCPWRNFCHRAPCITEHQPYTKLASGGDVGQAGNDAADEHRGKVGRRWKTGRRPLRQSQRSDRKRARRSDREPKMVQRDEGRDCCWCWYLGHVVFSVVLTSDLITGRRLPDQTPLRFRNMLSSWLGCQICSRLNYAACCKPAATPHLLPVLK